ncbi:hypothetical protein LguiB_023037 [Lonicera macranthoides]
MYVRKLKMINLSQMQEGKMYFGKLEDSPMFRQQVYIFANFQYWSIFHLQIDDTTRSIVKY